MPELSSRPSFPIIGPMPRKKPRFRLKPDHYAIIAFWAALLGESKSWRTNQIREVRHKTLQVAQKRVQTVLNRLSPKQDTGMSDELAAALDIAGL